MDQEVFSKRIHRYISLFSLYLNKKEATDFKIEDQELRFFFQLSKHHSLCAFLHKALKDTRVDVSNEGLKKLEEYYYANLRKSVLFDEERKELYQFLNDEHISFLPLKGIIIKDFYLDPYTREFADNDILFDSKDSLIKEYFVKRGYEVEMFRNGNHDVYHKKPFFNFEMHRALFIAHEDFPKYVSYFKDYLRKASIKEGYEYELNKEDFYIYFTAHTYKHFHESGCGIRTLVDYYQYLKNNKLDFDYINQELAKIDLVDFSNMIFSLSIKLFDNQPLTKEEEETLLYIASSGTYGLMENLVNKGVKEKGKFGFFLYKVFPPYSFYEPRYPWAYKCPILIPIAWLVRLFKLIFIRPKRTFKMIKTINHAKKEVK